MSRILFGQLTATSRTVGRRSRFSQIRLFTNTQQYDALVLGAYTDGSAPIALSASRDISAETRQKVIDQLAVSNFRKAGDVRLLYNVGGIKQVAVVSLGKQAAIGTKGEAEAARSAAALGVQALKGQDVKHVGVDVSLHPQGAAEGAVLSLFAFDKLKHEKKRQPTIRIGPFGQNTEADIQSWETGHIYGTSQNLARMLMTSPANLMTPKLFADEVAYLLAGLENTEVNVHDEEWAARHDMNALMAVAKGSKEPLRFLEIIYKGGKENQKPYGLVGKGVTFDAGGISLKPSNNMALMKGDMGGAATVVGALYGIIKLGLPVNVVAVIPLCENLPSGSATKPGDVIKAMNGKSIEVIDTDAEGRLILADALYYISSKHNPQSIVDLATLTGAMDVALGNVYAGVFTNSDDLWRKLEQAGRTMADPFWRMPLHEGYLKEMKESLVADLNNLGKGRSGGSCSAAMFLKEFVAGIETEEDKETSEDAVAWAHIDIAGVMDSQATQGYHIKGMSGRPTRSIIEYVKQANQKV
ncbi:hypothetical protein EC973_004855 [Apophysomyces ossiformis]|uniref:Cytosol aminopeptidase domain-containing protein n=1 Tax=Apophysomyces ossiformis TaxID=679940 RepID=A0A8H7BJR1_9FUNG|nr:hypothetical protein EC973_004855 [Apophysomyces ossiformis]